MGRRRGAIEAGYMQDEIEQAAYTYATEVDSGQKVIVGVNKFVDDQPESGDVFPIDPAWNASRWIGSAALGRSATRLQWKRPWPTSGRRPGDRATCCPRSRRPCAGVHPW